MSLMSLFSFPNADKVLHLIAGALVSLGVLGVLWIASAWNVWAAMIAGAAGVGVAYEVVQKIRNEGTPDWRDAVATALGGALVVLLCHIP